MRGGINSPAPSCRSASSTALTITSEIVGSAAPSPVRLGEACSPFFARASDSLLVRPRARFSPLARPRARFDRASEQRRRLAVARFSKCLARSFSNRCGEGGDERPAEGTGSRHYRAALHAAWPRAQLAPCQTASCVRQPRQAAARRALQSPRSAQSASADIEAKPFAILGEWLAVLIDTANAFSNAAT